MDSSVFVKTILSEPESAAVQRELTLHTLVSSRLLVVECRRAVVRADEGPQDLLRLERRLGSVDLRNIDDVVLDLASRVSPTSLRSLDAIHLATALRIPGIDVFVCLDDRLCEAASAVGLQVVSPR